MKIFFISDDSLINPIHTISFIDKRKSVFK